MFTRDEHNAEILKVAQRAVDLARPGQPLWPLLSKIETARNAAAMGTLVDYDRAIDGVRSTLIEYVGESELPEWVERPAEEALTPAELRDAYNLTILEEALACQSENEDEDDAELNAQIAYLQEVFQTEAADHAADHLRVMLSVSYLDDSDLPDEIPPARGAAPTFPSGDPREMFEIRANLTRAQIDAIWSVLDSVIDYDNAITRRAAQLLMAAVPQEYFEPGTPHTR